MYMRVSMCTSVCDISCMCVKNYCAYIQWPPLNRDTDKGEHLLIGTVCQTPIIFLLMLVYKQDVNVSLDKGEHLFNDWDKIHAPWPSRLSGVHCICNLYIHVCMFLKACFLCVRSFIAGTNNTALLWQKEASDIPSKFELLMFSYFT